MFVEMEDTNTCLLARTHAHTLSLILSFSLSLSLNTEETRKVDARASLHPPSALAHTAFGRIAV